MKTLPTIQLHKDQDRRIKAGHLWIYNNEINTNITPLGNFQPGDLVVVQSSQNQKLGIATLNPHTLLCARLLTRNSAAVINSDFFIRRLGKALQLRESLYAKPYYRWVFSEADLLPGLIIDRFDDIIVMQCNTAGIDQCQNYIMDAIVKLISPKSIIIRNDSAYRKIEHLPQYVSTLYGEDCQHTIIEENHCFYQIDLKNGQKTGWFFDHRDNRRQIAQYAADKNVLDLFCYQGAFTFPLIKLGAKHITGVDISKTAIQSVIENAKLNHSENKITTYQKDAFDFFAEIGSQKFDLIILDPPAFIKKKKDYHQGLNAYEKLNQLALSALNPNGFLLTASCSMHLSDKDLLNCLRRASNNLKRPLKIIEQLHQGRDHPIHPAIPETNYLKGFIAYA